MLNMLYKMRNFRSIETNTEIIGTRIILRLRFCYNNNKKIKNLVAFLFLAFDLFVWVVLPVMSFSSFKPTFMFISIATPLKCFATLCIPFAYATFVPQKFSFVLHLKPHIAQSPSKSFIQPFH